MIAKVTLLFQEDTGGWSESYYITAASLNDVQLKTNVANMVSARFGIMSRRVSFLGARFSDPAVFRDSRFHFAGPGDIFAGLEPFWNVQATELDTAVVQRLEAGNQVRRLNLLRGCPEFIVNTTSNTYLPNPPPPNNLWSAKMASFNLCMMGQPFAGFPPASWQLYAQEVDQTKCPLYPTSVAIPAPPLDQGNRVFTFVSGANPFLFVPAPGVAQRPILPGDPVSIIGAPGSHGIVGHWRVANVVPLPPAPGLLYTYTVFPERHLVQVSGPGQSAFVRGLSFKGVNIDNAIDEKLAYRKTGRPFGQLRGRRRAAL